MSRKEIPIANAASLLDLAMVAGAIEGQYESELVEVDLIVDKPTKSITLAFASPTKNATLDVKSAIVLRDALTSSIASMLEPETDEKSHAQQ